MIERGIVEVDRRNKIKTLEERVMEEKITQNLCSRSNSKISFDMRSNVEISLDARSYESTKSSFYIMLYSSN